MTERDRLVQRFLDQELSADERVRFIRRLGQDETLRRQVIALEQIALDASRLPRPAVPAGFVQGVLDRVAPVPMTPASMPAWRRLADWLVAPRTLQWNAASAIAAVGLVALLTSGLVMELTRSSNADSPGSLAVADSPETVLVRLVVVVPDASTVEVAGDFNGWDPARTPLAAAGNGAWTVMLPLEPGRYEYMFVVNGEQWIADPFAVERSDDGFGSQNAVLDVRPAGAV
jgi:hypothetical protein